MNTYDPIGNIVRLHAAPRTDADPNLQLELFPAGDALRPAYSEPAPAHSLLTLPRPRPNEGTSSSLGLVPPATGFSAPEQLRLFSDEQPTETTDGALAARLATAPGLVRAGASSWDGGRTPIHPLSMESAYADPMLLADLGARGARFARSLGVDVVVGAETAGVPLAASVALAAGLPFAYVRKPGYRGHEIDEPPVRGADVAGRRVLLVDDAVSSGTAVERFTAALAGAGAEVAGVFVLVDMREVADTVTSVAAALPTESVSTYLDVLALATANGVLDPAVHKLSVEAILNKWVEDDPRWDLLPMAA
jgi:orotate phosphoribosyltransferase